MRHFVRIRLRLFLVEDEHVEYADAYFGTEEEWDIRGQCVYGHYEEVLPETHHLRFDQRQNTLTRMKFDSDTITREEYYRRS